MSMNMFSVRGRRALSLVAAVVLGVGLLAACGSSDDDTAAAGSTIAVEGKFGTTQVPKDPKRVVTVGYNDQDFTLALGVVPVQTRAFFDSYNDLPWVKAATGGKGVPSMAGDSINLEEIAKAKPDVIFAIYETIDQKTYDQLSKIAPTVIQSSQYKDEETPWDVQLLTTGKALGKEQQAQALVDQVKAKIDEAKAAHPEFAGKTLVVDYGPENGGHYLIGKNDPRRALFDGLGFNAQDTVGDVSEEKLSLLDRDVLFVEGATKSQMAASPAFTRLDVVRDDKTLYTTFDSPLAGALSYSGPNALLYAINVVVPQLSNALTGKPVADLATA
ncbi:ABC transporter substrate-binding protein [Williamsia maris]|uniref:Iron complex transport system substrate-binding protein n=1 Tax=Williamsia maris TaxID=72806 RepID=A0ABT1HDU2_9NOCA|nr:ABC transporter substrate-binding protein [Williamsia maris]MCP2176428.1 iron complex transport system substrate-binding protein [Williamsia maris]